MTCVCPRLAAKLLRHVRQLLPDQRGNVALVVAAVFPLLIGAAGLAIDGTAWVLQKRQIQQAADSAAMTGVYSLIASQDMQNSVNSSIVHSGTVADNASIEAVQSPPGHENDPFAVKVAIATPARMIFSRMFMHSPPVITADATASVVQNGQFCAFALGAMRDEPGLVLRPNSNVEMDCGVTTNSSSPTALDADTSSTLQALALRAFGSFGYGNARKAIHDSGVHEQALEQDDPLQDTDPPLIPNTGCPNATVNPGGQEVALDPGCYGNMNLNGNVRLQDGEYILNRGNFIVGPQAHVQCDACTIFLTSDAAATEPGSIGKVKMSTQGTVKLSATREGPNAGILFYQDRHAPPELPGDENRIGGNSFSKLSGMIYFPTETIYVDGNDSPDVKCSRFIARRLVFAGRVYVGKGCDTADKMMFAVTEVRLIS
jgi:Flp pilus assembly protein TadG